MVHNNTKFLRMKTWIMKLYRFKNLKTSKKESTNLEHCIFKHHVIVATNFYFIMQLLDHIDRVFLLTLK